jgi:hypothetical protein
VQVAQVHLILILEVRSPTLVAAVAVQAMVLFNPVQAMQVAALVDLVLLEQVEQPTEAAAVVVVAVLIMVALVALEL